MVGVAARPEARLVLPGGPGGGTSASIYDAGNLVIWWLGIPAMAFAAVMAWRAPQPALTLIAVGFAAQWISWARIDRAAFQYHYYTALPFVVLALAYFLAELWHGASRTTWLLARVGAAVADPAAAVLWVLSRPLCGFVDVVSVNPGSQACPAVIPDFVLTVAHGRPDDRDRGRADRADRPRSLDFDARRTAAAAASSRRPSPRWPRSARPWSRR